MSGDHSIELSRAETLLQGGRGQEALEICQAVLAGTPASVAAQELLGRILTEHGRPAVAAMILEGVAAQRPDDAGARVALAHAYRLAVGLDDAERAARAALDLDPDSLEARLVLADTLLRGGRPDDARGILEDADGDPRVSLMHANALAAAGRQDEARSAFEAAAQAAPELRGVHLRAWNRLRNAGDDAGALQVLELGAVLAPEDPELRHLLAAARGEDVPARASDAYLVQYFDSFAPSFDHRLQGLGYSPDKLLPLITPWIEARTGELDVLDAGCGTGLLGAALRPLSRRLVGVDISPGMLERAEKLGHYDELFAEELTRYLESVPGHFDLIVCADVLVYFGELGPVMRLLAEALKPDGLVTFSVERASDGVGTGLGDAGRWAHSVVDVRRAARGAGLMIELRDDVLRQERDEPVPALLCVARRGSPAASPRRTDG